VLLILGQVGEIIKACSNPVRKISMWSATILPEAEELARNVMHNQIRIVVGPRYACNFFATLMKMCEQLM